MGHSEYDPVAKERRPWNAGRKLGAKRALKPQQVWAIRFWLDRERRLRDRAQCTCSIPAGSRAATARNALGDLRLLKSSSSACLPPKRGIDRALRSPANVVDDRVG
jgi:hypothetical protein